ncbi:hypothetical protein AV530_005869 [Patagioenas fasciata monilis]|uniref:Uncharacterized protein n=1 Tax=Patagioenas fasciata monilis TaxID=372326 RepID=A0A1V4JP77_PATFA|nr:hypothetical protein AV530_005869 [Patagioenas fasciata monilis]
MYDVRLATLFSAEGEVEPQVSPWQDNFSDGGTLKSWPLLSDDLTGLPKTFRNSRSFALPLSLKGTYFLYCMCMALEW